MSQPQQADVVIIGAGSIGIAVAYYLGLHQPDLRVVVVENASPMALTSAQSGENYRNWWPHPIMKRFMDRSIELMEAIARDTDNRIQLTARGYLLATRKSANGDLLNNLSETFSESDALRHHSHAKSYRTALEPTPRGFTDGVDIVESREAISSSYPQFDPSVKTLFHIRRGGMLSAQQMGTYMLEQFRLNGGKLIRGSVTDLDVANHFTATITNDNQTSLFHSGSVVNAAGPFVNDIANMLSIDLPVSNVLQQKIAFEDTHKTIDRRLPFAIDLDEQNINWTHDEREALTSDPDLDFLINTMPGSIHCRPEGGDHGSWIKLGWAYNQTPSQPTRSPALDEFYPEIVLRGAARLQPGLKAYLKGFPRNFSHYGGYYTLTKENWPLIGETEIPGFYTAAALSGFGTMAACGTGELIANTIIGHTLPDFASDLSLRRYQNKPLMAEINALHSRGIL